MGTTLASIALVKSKIIPVRLKAFKWLLHSAGKESNWLWKWKFQTVGKHLRFDPNKFGWPWQSGTLSWVVPTAFAIVVLNPLPCPCGFEDAELRVQRGVEMLLDRVCATVAGMQWAGVTLAMKNMFGVIPGLKYGWPKNILHWKWIHQSILDAVRRFQLVSS